MGNIGKEVTRREYENPLDVPAVPEPEPAAEPATTPVQVPEGVPA